MRDMAPRRITYGQAIREALDQAMETDENVVVIGEGVPDPKAIFSTTSGLQEKFGPRRVFDMPLSENGVTGICIGAAISGIRPVMVHQRIDFALLAMDQLINNAAKWHYMFDGQATVPLVVRVIVGRGWGQGPQHSQSLQSLFAHVPGIKVVMPTTAHDAKGMMLAAIADENPVLMIEHRWLHHIEDNVPPEAYQTPLEGAAIRTTGTDVTITAFSYMVIECLLAAKALLDEMNIGVEVLDMRCVNPLDHESVLTSIAKTGRILVVDAAFRNAGIAGELISRLAEYGMSSLKAAPVRVTLPDHPAPTSHHMMAEFYPNARTIADDVLRLIGAETTPAQRAALDEKLRRVEPHDVPSRQFVGPF